MITDFGLSKMEQNGIMSTACGTPGYVGKARLRNGLVLGDCLEERSCTCSTLSSRKGKIHNYISNNMLLGDAPHGPRKDRITDEWGLQNPRMVNSAKGRIILRAMYFSISHFRRVIEK